MAPAAAKPLRIALAGLMLESNRFAPRVTRGDFEESLLLEGDALKAAILPSARRAPGSPLPPEALGFLEGFAAAGPFEALPLLFARVEAGGPLEHATFSELLARIEAGLLAAGPLDGLYLSLHGAMLTTELEDPDGFLLKRLRSRLGPEVPIVATLDLHANLSEAMVEAADLLLSYRTNPHVDMRARGREAASALREMLGGMKTAKAFIRLPIVPPTLTLLTAEGAGPYADLWQHALAPAHPDLLNVSILGGFAYSDTAKNGLALLVTTRGDLGLARRLAALLGEVAWNMRERFRVRLTPLSEAVARARAAAEDPALPPVILADVADNPGGGGRSNRLELFAALREAGVREALLGLHYDPPLAAEAAAQPPGSTFRARLNRDLEAGEGLSLELTARVLALSDGHLVGRRGFYAGRELDLGPSALLEIDGLKLAVVSRRLQCCDPALFEIFGLDLAGARSLVVKSRGHFRAGFDEFFAPEQVIEVDAPGLTSPLLERIPFRHLPRPVIPLDEGVVWQPPAGWCEGKVP